MGTNKLMESFLNPRSVAIFGLSRRTGRGAFNIAENLMEVGFKGQIYPVNPNADSILGLKVYPSAREIPVGTDLGIVTVERRSVPRVIAEAAEQGIKAFIVFTEGFAEADEEGKALQSEIVAIAKNKGARIIGPNSLGLLNGFNNFSSSIVASHLKPSPVAFICQSGGFLEGFTEFTPGKSIDLGNMCDVDFAEVLDYIEFDPEIRLVGLHIEGLTDGRRFLQAAARVQRRKPVLVLKTGRSERAACAAASHTASLSGRDEVSQAAFKQAGLIQVANVDELGDITKALLYLPPPKGNRVAIITPSGGAATMSLDAMEQYGFDMACLSDETIDAIHEFFPAWSQPHNPVDMMAAGERHGYKMVYKATLEALLRDAGIDIILCIAGFPTLKTIASTIRGNDKPVITWVLGEWRENLFAKVRETGYRVVYPNPDRAFRAMAAVRDYSAGRYNSLT